MQQREVVVYIAMSLDGYIAKEDGDINWLSVVEKENEDYGYQDFVLTVDTVIMGRKTYDKIQSFDIPFPHQNKTCYVLSTIRKCKEKQVEYYHGDVEERAYKIHSQKSR